MAQTTTIDAATTSGKGLPARFAGVIFSPRATYADVAARPRVLGMVSVVPAIVVCAMFAFLSTDVGQQAALDNLVRQLEAFGRTISDAQYARMEQAAPYARWIAGGVQLAAMPIAALIVAALAYGVFNAALGGDARFKQLYAIVVHSGAILVIQVLFSLPLAYARENLSGATNLAVFVPVLDDASFAARTLGAVDLFLVWWLVSLAIGLGVLYRKRTAPIATRLLVIYVAIGLIIAAVKTAFAGV
jgi:hypothetical protein